MEKRNGKFRESIWFGNKKITSPSFHRESDAKKWKANKLNERTKLQILGDEFRTQTKLTFEEFSTQWHNEKIKPFKSPSTVRDFESSLRCHLNPILGNILLKDIKMKDADRLVTSLHIKGKTPKRILDIVTLLKQILNEAERREEIIKNPLRHFKCQKVPEKPLNYWSASEVNQFLLYIRNHELYPFFIAAFYTGMRKGEIAALTWDCINFQTELIMVKGTLDKYGHRESTKTGRIRYIPMHGLLKCILIELFKTKSSASNYVFLIQGKPIDTNHLYRVFGKLQKEAGITKKIRIHDTRHTFASYFMEKGVGTLYDLSTILGHTETKMTQRYAHLSSQHLTRVTKNLNFGSESELSKEFTPVLPQDEVVPKSCTNLELLRTM